MFQKIFKYHTLWATAALTALLAGCGGGGGSDDTPEPINPLVTRVEGMYAGTLGDPNGNYRFNALILENGEIWTLYGSMQPSGVFNIEGFLQGGGTSSQGSYSSSNLRDFGASPSDPASLAASYDTGTGTIRGNITVDSAVVPFAGTVVTIGYQYTLAADLASLAGNWSLSTLLGENVSVAVQADGNFTATTGSGCAVTGRFSTRPSGKNVFDASMRFGPAPCELPNETATGVAIAYPLEGGSQQLILAAVDSTRQYGFSVLGSR